MKKSDLNKIQILRQSNLTARQIADELNLTYNQVKHVIASNRDLFPARTRTSSITKPPSKRGPPKDLELVFSLLSDGMSAREVGEKTGRTKNSVIALFNRERERRGVSALRSEDDFYTEEDIERARVLWQQGVQTKQIAEALGRKGSNLYGLFNSRRELFPTRIKKENHGNLVFKLRNSVKDHSKPTPENTVIQYEFQEYDMPEDALMIPFVDIEAGQCGFLSGNFWDEPGPTTPCCGLPVYDPRGKGLRRANCEFHYKISIEEVK